MIRVKQICLLVVSRLKLMLIMSEELLIVGLLNG